MGLKSTVVKEKKQACATHQQTGRKATSTSMSVRLPSFWIRRFIYSSPTDCQQTKPL